MAEIGGQIHLGPTKTYQRRTVVLPRFLVEQLAALLARSESDGFVFTSPNGGPLRISNFSRRVWRPAVEAAGLDPALRIHDLRHTCAALLIAQGHIRKPSRRTSGTPRSPSPSIATGTSSRTSSKSWRPGSTRRGIARAWTL